ncbi:MlaD family protein [Legionella sp. CNM-4043-24]|uniref:MlaD family protein n=1 Tax=Legionella sp. CNM-4043-24 TaxID=3421646 RepID=UPI00403AF3CE
MEAKTNYTLVGLAVLILTAGLLITALWLSVGFDQKSYSNYVVLIREAVSGLSEESPVKFNGVQVGSVSKISLSRTDPRQVRLLLKIVEGTPITISTTATLISQGITGTTYVGLSASSSDLTPLKKLPDEKYPIIPSKPSLFHQLDSVLKEVSESVKTVSMKLNNVLDKENISNFKTSLSNLRTFTDVVARHEKDISESLKNLNAVSAELPAAIRQMSSAGKQISSTMKSGETAINKISQQTIPPAVNLLNKLNNIAANLEKISAQMRQNPAIVIRGTTAPTPGPGERK